MSNVKKLITAGICVALAMLLPFLTGQIPQIGSMLSPMHIPVLLCGLICGWKYGLLAGLITPLLRSAIFGMPPLFPTATAMAFELATYGLVSGVLYRMMRRGVPQLYGALIGAMLCGRIVWGIAMYALVSINGGAFTWAAFTAGAFVNAVPGIILHILIIPPIVLALKRAGFLKDD